MSRLPAECAAESEAARRVLVRLEAAIPGFDPSSPLKLTARELVMLMASVAANVLAAVRAEEDVR